MNLLKLPLNPVMIKELLSGVKVSLWDAIEWIDDSIRAKEPTDRIVDRILLTGELFGRVIDLPQSLAGEISDFPALLEQVFSQLSEQLSDDYYYDVAERLKERMRQRQR